jgi:hypothetical protein
MIDTIELKPGEYSFRDPKTLQPHPVSAALYLNGRDDWSIDARQMTTLEASNEIMKRMDVSDIQDSIARGGIREPLVINPEGIIISGCRRWKVARILGLPSVRVEVKTFPNEIEEKQAILDYNMSRVKNTSQTMREADLHIEIIGKLARKRILAGKRDPEPILAQGSKHQRKTNTIVGALSGMGKETFRKVEYIWQQAKSGDKKAVALIRNLDEKTTSINAAFNTLKKDDNDLNPPPLSKWQLAEPAGEGSVCACYCGKTYRLVHSKSGKHRLVETSESDNSAAPTPKAA